MVVKDLKVSTKKPSFSVFKIEQANQVTQGIAAISVLRIVMMVACNRLLAKQPMAVLYLPYSFFYTVLTKQRPFLILPSFDAWVVDGHKGKLVQLHHRIGDGQSFHPVFSPC